MNYLGGTMKYNKTNIKLYDVWQHIKQRCYNNNNQAYPNYGGRGIEVCKEWLDDFMTFYDWSINNGYKEGLTIDRIDVNGNYEPSNCRWVDRKIQARNRRNNRNITINGETHCLKDWCKILNLNYNTVSSRLHYNKFITVRKALGLEK